MVVNHLDDHDCRDLGFIGSASRCLGYGVRARLEHESLGATKVECVLAGAVARQRMEPAGGPAEIRERGSALQGAETPSEDGPLLRPESTDTGTIVRTVPGELSVHPRDLYLDFLLTQ